jgi:SAM-dependent methyltransferase
VDITPAMLEQAEKQQKAKSLANLSWKTADVANLPFEAGAFLRVVSRYTFHHFLEPQTVLGEMVRVCQPGGRVVVADVFTSEEQHKADRYNTMERLRDPSHTRALKQSELRRLMDCAGLQDVQTQFYRLHMSLDKILDASFPNPGDKEKLRQMFVEDLETGESDFEPYLDEQQAIRFSFPVMILSGRKPE